MPVHPLRALAIALTALLAAACTQDKSDSAVTPGSFKVRLAVEPAAGDSVQRVILPAEAMVAIRRADLGDVRIFDSRGKPLALARGGPDTAGTAQQRTQAVTVYPVLGGGDAGGGDVSITIGADRVAHVVARGGTANPGTGLVAALLDTRGVSGPVVAITLDAELPRQQPVTVTLETSADLSNWEPLAERVLFRAGDGAAPLGSGKFALAGQELKDRYVRASWAGAPGVAIRAASVTTARSAPLPRVAVTGSGIGLEGERAVHFSVPFGTPLAALHLAQTAPDGVVPVRVLGRDSAEQPWTPLAAGTLRPGEAGTTIDLWGANFRNYRVVADERSAGISAPPRLELLFDPVEVLAAFNGAPPYVLAVGRIDARPAWFAPTELAPQARIDSEALPIARVGGTAATLPAVALAPEAPDGPFSPRKLLLWGALLLGAAVLAFAAYRLLRANQAPGPDQAE